MTAHQHGAPAAHGPARAQDLGHEHDHAHDHTHTHAHGHVHGHGGHHHHHGDPWKQAPAFGIAIVLNTLLVVAQFGYGLAANSTALMADAGHNLSDVLGLVLALLAAVLSRREPKGRYTYGLRSSSMLAALANAVLLLLASGAIAWEAAQRMVAPPPVAGLTVTLVAAVGIVVNGLSAWLLLRGQKSDLNVRGAYLHMLSDTVVSLGVVVAGLAIMATGWYWLDPLVSVAIVALIVYGTWGLLRESLDLILSAVPAGIDADEVAQFLRGRPGVHDVHDLHIWGMSTTENALTAHLVVPAGYPGDDALDAISEALRSRFGIGHSTLQVEQGTTRHACALHPSR
ncbi:cation diffusion facilitator family transporter [Thiomonas sp.]|jgi:cobalt-zinc-cadmium efflux system protein|uniref:cation diffusion facilitator family transporter n=1 Tax=Thiomonas sp. TaxID=2047785 RepID=UPI002626145D|nr:cation diffusion facilitator family transporter [Thiomonas sp.]